MRKTTVRRRDLENKSLCCDWEIEEREKMGWLGFVLKCKGVLEEEEGEKKKEKERDKRKERRQTRKAKGKILKEEGED
jgi:hypothetical protein